MRSLMTSQQRSDVSESGRETGDARQASAMMSEGQDGDGLQWRHHRERKKWWMCERDRRVSFRLVFSLVCTTRYFSHVGCQQLSRYHGFRLAWNTSWGGGVKWRKKKNSPHPSSKDGVTDNNQNWCRVPDVDLLPVCLFVCFSYGRTLMLRLINAAVFQEINPCCFPTLLSVVLSPEVGRLKWSKK